MIFEIFKTTIESNKSMTDSLTLGICLKNLPFTQFGGEILSSS